jgi:hypothetical protein
MKMEDADIKKLNDLFFKKYKLMLHLKRIKKNDDVQEILDDFLTNFIPLN